MAFLSSRTGVSASASWLLVLIGFYLVVPVAEFPIVGVSLCAPLFLLLVLEWGLTCGGQLMRGRWFVLPALCWFAGGASLAAGLWSGRLSAIRASELLLLLRSAYWCLVLVVVAALVCRVKQPERIAVSLAMGVFGIATLRLIEAFALGRVGGETTRWLSPNEYGMGFSTFSPFLIWCAFTQTGYKRWLAITAFPIAAAALAINGSRSSWLAVLLGSGVLFVLLRVSHRTTASRLLGPACAAVGTLLLLASISARSQLVERWSTLADLHRDKPFQTRLALVEKGTSLFQAQPVFGIGLGRFTVESATFDSSRTPWATADELNSRSPHNAYIKVLAETGLFGALPLIALLATLFVTGFPASLALARSGETWGLAAMAAMCGMCLHLWTLSGLTNTAPWFLFGLVAAVTERRRRMP